MLAFSAEGTIKNIFVICAHKFFFRISLNTLLHLTHSNQVWVVENLYVVNYCLLTTTLSISPKSFALSGVIKLSLSRADLISSTDLFVCLE